MRPRMPNITRPSTTSSSCVGYTLTTSVGVIQLVHHLHRRGRQPLWEADGQRAIPHAAIVVAHRPASGAPDRVARGDSDRRAVGDAQNVQPLGTDDDGAEGDGPDEATPEDE